MLGFETIIEDGDVVGAKVDLTKVLSFLISRLNLPPETKWKIGADGRPNGRKQESVVSISALCGKKDSLQSPSNVFPLLLLRGNTFSLTFIWCLLSFRS